MKHFSSLLACCVLMVSYSLGQGPSVKASGWESPSFDKFFVLKNRIQAIEVQSFEQGPHTPSTSQATLYEYDAKGNLVHIVETQQTDTARIQNFTYTQNGTLTSKVVTDKVWDRNYKSWYRFNRMRKVYQVKSYELLRNNETMLLDTKQYVYNEDSLLTAIRFLENNHLLRTQEYEYDLKGRVIAETFVNRSNIVERKILYTYNNDNQLTRVKTVNGENDHSEYIYVYNSSGDPIEVQWRENGLLIGTVTYDYNDKGLLTRMERSINEADNKESTFVRVFDYKMF
ncbi:MAG: hypothetical protein AAFQ68_00890 [Bacteroidota bacterium]